VKKDLRDVTLRSKKDLRDVTLRSKKDLRDVTLRSKKKRIFCFFILKRYCTDASLYEE